jgi:hypothetical protein
VERQALTFLLSTVLCVPASHRFSEDRAPKAELRLPQYYRAVQKSLLMPLLSGLSMRSSSPSTVLGCLSLPPYPGPECGVTQVMSVNVLCPPTSVTDLEAGCRHQREEQTITCRKQSHKLLVLPCWENSELEIQQEVSQLITVCLGEGIR